MQRSLILSPEKEKARYDTHNNDIEDPGYQKFVAPIIEEVTKSFSPDSTGLDFGAGPGPVISKLLKERGYNISKYDPYYFPDSDLLENTYDYLVCCEVIEHFNKPAAGFSQLRKLLKTDGKLVCMTLLYKPEIDLNKWFYASDETHVFFYQKSTLEFIKIKYGFADLKIENRLVVFSA